MASRVGQIAAQLDPRTWSGKGLAAHSLKHDDDVVIIATGRSAFCKASKGGLKDTPVDIFAMEFFKAMIARMPIEPSLVEDIVIGNVRNKDNVYDLRAAAVAAGFPPETGVLIVNRFCSSGGMAVRAVANAIQAGEIDCGLACGVEMMTHHPKPGGWDFSPEVKAQNQNANDCAMPMLQTSENVAGDFGISREAMDAFAARSHQRAEAAQASGKFDAEIMPITVDVLGGVDGKTKERKVLSKDEGIRPGTKAETLGKIRAAAPQWSPSNTTGGNASQVTDGAAGVLLMRRSMAKKLGLTPRAKYVASTVTGLAPRIMGIGPSLAIPKVLDLTGITMDQVDLFEINEAFASMAVYCQNKLQIPDDKINVNGGAIALGHPLGTTGARLILTVLEELERRDQKVGVTSACIGTGMGWATVILRE